MLHHSCEMDGNLTVFQDPAIGEAHLGDGAARLHRDLFGDHDGLGVLGLGPEHDVVLQILDPEDPLQKGFILR